MKQDKYMGMYVHQAMTVAVVLDAEGKVILETMVSTEAAAILRLVKSGAESNPSEASLRNENRISRRTRWWCSTVQPRRAAPAPLHL